MRRGLVVALSLAIGCGSPLAPRRPLVTDRTPLGTPRAEVDAWHRAHGWCDGRPSEGTDEYVACEGLAPPRCNPRSPDLRGRSTDGPCPTAEGPEQPVAPRRLHVWFRYADERAVAIAVFVPLRDATEHPTANVVAPFLARDGGLTRTPTSNGRALPSVAIPDAHAGAVDALEHELITRHGAAPWTSEHGDAMIWTTADEVIGLFVRGHWVVETHEPLAATSSATR